MSNSSAVEPWLPRLVALDDVSGTVVVACSGGADSLALLALAGAAGFDVVAAHVDHGLRSGTGHDHAVVGAAAERFGARMRLVKLHLADGPNLEARARDARYAALESVRIEVGASVTLVGHTADDQAETVLLGLLRGSAAAGMAGMPAARDHLRRPMLRLRRSDTVEMCARLGLAPVDDPMNSDVRHRRVWLRREVVPRLASGARRDVVEVLARQADVLRDDDELLDAMAVAAVDVEGASLVIDAVLSVPRPLARRAVRRWLGPPPPSLAHVDAVLEVISGARRAVDLPGGRRVERARGRLHLVDPGATRPDSVVLSLPGRAAFGDWSVEAWIEDGVPTAWPDGRTTAVLDADAVGDTVAMRSPRAGDRFRPVGGAGSKLVHDALAEVGIPASARADRPVLIDPVEGIVWVVGYRIDHRVRVTSRTRRFLWVASEVSGT